jgi:tetratricopeptide (TPR) repeat protein
MKILHIALQSHRDALVLDQDNADVLFNTAQVLTSLAEVLTESKRPSEGKIDEAMKYLNEALELFQRCLVLQELRYTECQEEFKMMDSNNGDATSQTMVEEQTSEETETASEQVLGSDSPVREEWAAVIEPVTKDTLIDTAVAQLETLATLCGLLALVGGNALAWVEEYSYDLLRTKIAAYVEGTGREQEVGLARARFLAALTEVLYRIGRIDVETYQRELSGAFPPELDLSDDPEGLCSKAEALTSFNSAIADIPPTSSLEEGQKSLILRWQGLSAALEALTAASKLATADNVSKIHIARGDVEMARWHLGRPPWNHAAAHENAATLLKNAQTYYRGAVALARRDGDSEQEQEGSCKEALAAALAGDKSKLDQLKTADSERAFAIIQDMVEDSLVALADAESLLA